MSTFSMFLCDVINWSIILVLNLSGAHCDLHELSTLVVLALMVVWPLGPCLGELAQLILSLLGDNVVSTDLLGDFSEFGVLVHCCLGDRDHSINYIPKDALHQWSSRQGNQRR